MLNANIKHPLLIHLPGILQASLLEWIAIPFSRVSDPGVKPGSPALLSDSLPSDPPKKPTCQLYLNKNLALSNDKEIQIKIKMDTILNPLECKKKKRERSFPINISNVGKSVE